MTRARGFTLIEMLISVAILAFVIAGVSLVLIKQSQASVNQTAQRDLEESGRLALLELARAVRQAGYGITPLAAFDFDRFACTAPGTASSCPNGGRDRQDGPDELVVAWRDPMFSRAITAKTGSVGGPYSVTVAALTATLNAGRIVQLLCSGAEPSAYLALNADAAAGSTTLSLRLLTAADGYFPAADATDACFASATLFAVERVRYYVANDTDGVPALFRDRGRGVQELLYRGVEDLQISYDIGQPPAASPFAAGGATPAAAPGCLSGGNATWSFGSCPGVVGTPLETSAPDWRNDAYDSVNRYTGNAANIRNVNVFVVARARDVAPGTQLTSSGSQGQGDDVPALANRLARARDNYHRAVLSIAAQPQNLLTRAHFLPPIFTTTCTGATCDTANVGGG